METSWDLMASNWFMDIQSGYNMVCKYPDHFFMRKYGMYSDFMRYNMGYTHSILYINDYKCIYMYMLYLIGI